MAGIVLAYLSRLGTPMLTHEKVTLEAVARSVAQIKHYEFAGWHDITNRYSDDIYFVPDDTLMPDEAAFLGIRSPSEFFGGVVSHPFVKTKAITHQLVSASRIGHQAGPVNSRKTCATSFCPAIPYSAPLTRVSQQNA